MGIHNEPGSDKKTTNLPGLIETMLAHCLDTSDADRAFLQISSDDQVVLLVNNLGGVSMLELAAITNEAVGQLKGKWKIDPLRILAGTYMTSLNGMGFSISLLKLADTDLKNKTMLNLLDAPAQVTGWTAPVRADTWEKRFMSTETTKHAAAEASKPSNLKSWSSTLASKHQTLTKGSEPSRSSKRTHDCARSIDCR